MGGKKKKDVESNEAFFIFKKDGEIPEIWVEKNLAMHDPEFAELIRRAIDPEFLDQMDSFEDRPKKILNNLNVVVGRFDEPHGKYTVTKCITV